MRHLPSAIALIASLSIPCLADSYETVTLGNGMHVTISTFLGNPTGVTTISTRMVRASGDSFYRIFEDQNQLAIFAYELRIARAGDRGFTVTAEPATVAFALKFPNADGGKPTPTFSSKRTFSVNSPGPPPRPAKTAVQIPVRGSVNIPVFKLEGQGLDVVDYVKLALNRSKDGCATAPAGIQFSNLQVAINGALVSNSTSGTVAGKYAMFYIPDHGGYFFSTTFQPRFLKIAPVSDKKMQFMLDGALYECLSQLPISQAVELWVYRDPAYRPEGSWTKENTDGFARASERFFTGASDTLDWWLDSFSKP